MLHDVAGRITSNVIKPASEKRYAHRLIQCANRNQEGAEGNKRRTRTGLIKVLGLIQKRKNQSDPRLAWFMLHKIYRMYSDIKNKEEINAAMILTSMS